MIPNLSRVFLYRQMGALGVATVAALTGGPREGLEFLGCGTWMVGGVNKISGATFGATVMGAVACLPPAELEIAS